MPLKNETRALEHSGLFSPLCLEPGLGNLTKENWRHEETSRDRLDVVTSIRYSASAEPWRDMWSDSCHAGACHAALPMGWHKLYECCREGFIGQCQKSCVLSTSEYLHSCPPHVECVVIFTTRNAPKEMEHSLWVPTGKLCYHFGMC